MVAFGFVPAIIGICFVNPRQLTKIQTTKKAKLTLTCGHVFLYFARRADKSRKEVYKAVNKASFVVGDNKNYGKLP